MFLIFGIYTTYSNIFDDSKLYGYILYGSDVTSRNQRLPTMWKKVPVSYSYANQPIS
jgi:hypothetical protein